MNERINEVIEEQIENLKKMNNNEFYNLIKDATDLLVNCLKNGGKILIAGNGGSASDAQHFVGEIVGRFEVEREGWSAIALNTDTSVMTAIANDYGYDDIFARQIEGLANISDVFIAISTSGNSKNIIKAVEKAHEKGLKVIGLLGKDGGELKNICDLNIIFNYSKTARIQEHHIMVIHLLCEFIEKEMTLR